MPASCSRLSTVEGVFAKLPRRRLRYGVFRSVAGLQAAINRFIAEHNAEPRHFVWTADLDKIIDAVKRDHHALDFIHWGLIAWESPVKGPPAMTRKNLRYPQFLYEQKQESVS